MEDEPRSLMNDLDLLGLAFRSLPFRYIGVLAQVSLVWRRFAQDTHWMRDRVCFSYGAGGVNGQGRDRASPTLLELSMRADVHGVVCGHRTTFFLCEHTAYWVGQSWSPAIPDAGIFY